MKIAIVTTLIDGEQVIDSFINYHLAIGFHHLYLFFDDPNDDTIKKVEGRKNVTIFRCNDELRGEWTKTNAYAAYGHLSSFIDVEPMARQILNMDIACQMAKKDGIDWLLHIDIDELFYSPHENVTEHFSQLNDANLFFKRYLNYEAIPEKEDIIDYFKEVTLFKKNALAYSAAEQASHTNYIKKDLFKYYKIGKMAGKVDKIFISGIHEFVFDRQNIGRPLSIPPPERTEPIILHYVCCGFESFWKKYATLGDFNPKTFGRQLYSTYEKSQGIVKQNNKDLAREFYKGHIMLSDEEKTKLQELNLTVRITQPAVLLSQLTSSAY